MRQEWKSPKNSNGAKGNRTRNLPACSTVPQPPAPPRGLALPTVTSWRNGYNQKLVDEKQPQGSLTSRLKAHWHITYARHTLKPLYMLVLTATDGMTYWTPNRPILQLQTAILSGISMKSAERKRGKFHIAFKKQRAVALLLPSLRFYPAVRHQSNLRIQTAF